MQPNDHGPAHRHQVLLDSRVVSLERLHGGIATRLTIQAKRVLKHRQRTALPVRSIGSVVTRLPVVVRGKIAARYVMPLVQVVVSSLRIEGVNQKPMVDA